MAMELSERTWKVLFATTAGGRRERSAPARDLSKLWQEVAVAKRRFGRAPQARVMSCYEAGRDGFWLDRRTIEALRNCVRKRRAAIDELWRYARIDGVHNVMRPYLQTIL